MFWIHSYKIIGKINYNLIYTMVDETTNFRGMYICSLIIGILHPKIMLILFFISCKELKKTNYETVFQYVNDNLTDFLETRRLR